VQISLLILFFLCITSAATLNKRGLYTLLNKAGKITSITGLATEAVSATNKAIHKAKISNIKSQLGINAIVSVPVPNRLRGRIPRTLMYRHY
jgi:hypothetical protein